MFSLKEFIVKNIVNGIKNGTWSKEYANIMAVDYLVKGILTEDDVAGIDAQITAWEADKASTNVDVPEEVITELEEAIVPDEPVTEEPDEEVTEPTEEPETNEPEETENETVSEESEPENTETETDSGENETVE